MKGEHELRCYTFTLFQLSSIQQGIQAGHAAVELMLKHPRTDVFHLNSVDEWAHYWKTMVLLNGGDVYELRELIMFFSLIVNPYPWTVFYESEESLDGIPTSIAIILPDRIFITAENLRKMKAGEEIAKFGFTEWEYKLIERLSKTSLAR